MTLFTEVFLFTVLSKSKHAEDLSKALDELCKIVPFQSVFNAYLHHWSDRIAIGRFIASMDKIALHRFFSNSSKSKSLYSSLSQFLKLLENNKSGDTSANKQSEIDRLHFVKLLIILSRADKLTPQELYQYLYENPNAHDEFLKKVVGEKQAQKKTIGEYAKLINCDSAHEWPGDTLHVTKFIC